MPARIAATALAVMSLSAASAPTAESEVARARKLAGSDFADSLFLCEPLTKRSAGTLTAGQNRIEPTRAFDNLFYVGTSFVGIWALRTSEGLILFDAGESERDMREHIEPGLRSLGLDPATVRYALVTHGHWDHYGGAKYLQDTYGTRIAMPAADWDLLERALPGSLERAATFGEDRSDRVPPRRDMVVADGDKLRLGDTEVALYVTPGHTNGTLSALIPARERGRTYILSLLGGTAFPPQLEPNERTGGLLAFERSVKRLSDMSAKAGAVGILNTHVSINGSDKRLAMVRQRRPGQPNPFVLGSDKVARYYGMFEACLKAAQLRPAAPAIDWSKDSLPPKE